MIAPIEIETVPTSSVIDEATTIRVGNPRDLSVFRTIVAIGAVQVITMLFTLVRSKVVAISAGPAGVGALHLHAERGQLVPRALPTRAEEARPRLRVVGIA